MSTSDSDYSIDWLASEDDDALGSLDGSDPRFTEEPWAPPSTSSLRGSPTSCCCCRATQRRRRQGGVTADSAQQTSPTSPAQGFTSIYAQPSVEPRRRLSRKRAHSGGLDGLCEKAAGHSEDQLFSQKCWELQCYIQPLASILQSLRSGRYSERLSSFQESVAMDRIQRIMGVLQNPNMGGRFLTTIVKIEGMLQSWFPHIKATVSPTDDGVSAKRQKRHSSPSFSSSSPPALESLCSSDVEPAHPTPNSSTHLKWLQVAPVCSLKTPVGTPSQRASSDSPLPASCAQEVTQDNSVSSSTDRHGGPPRRLAAAPRPSRGPLPFKISSPCLERLLQAKESIIAPRVAGGGAWLL